MLILTLGGDRPSRVYYAYYSKLVILQQYLFILYVHSLHAMSDNVTLYF